MNGSLALPEAPVYAVPAAPSSLAQEEGSAAVVHRSDNRRQAHTSQNPTPTPYSWNTVDVVAPEVLELWRAVSCDIDENQTGTQRKATETAGS
jgi:hypothetical protein